MNTFFEIIGHLISLSSPSILFEKSDEEMDENEKKELRKKKKSFWKGLGVLMFIFIGGYLLGWMAFKIFG